MTDFFKTALFILAFFAAAAAVILGIMLVPQVGFALFIEYGGGPMLIPMLALIILGYLRRQSKDLLYPTLAVAFCVLFMVNQRGFYWELFDRDRGFFTANRLSAHVLFAVAYCTADIHAQITAYRDRR